MVKPSKKIRGARKKVRMAKQKSRARKLRRRRKRRNLKKKVKQKAKPVTDEVKATKEELQGLKEDANVDEITSGASDLATSAGSAFDTVFAVDQDDDGVLESNELGFGLDLNGDDEIDQTEIFAPVSPPQSDTEDKPKKRARQRASNQEEPPARRDPGHVAGLDRFLIGGAGPAEEDGERNDRDGGGLDDFLI